MNNHARRYFAAVMFFPHFDRSILPLVRFGYLHEGSRFSLFVLSNANGADRDLVDRSHSLLELSCGARVVSFQPFIPRWLSGLKSAVVRPPGSRGVVAGKRTVPSSRRIRGRPLEGLLTLQANVFHIKSRPDLSSRAIRCRHVFTYSGCCSIPTALKPSL